MERDICVWGASSAHGYVDIDRGGWAERLKCYAWEHLPDTTVYNLGISGDTTADLLVRFDGEAKTRSPHTVVFSIGMNDSSHYEDLSTEPDVFKENLRTLAQKAQMHTSRVVFIGLTRVDEARVDPYPHSSTKKAYSNERIAEFDAIIQKVAEETQSLYVPVYEAVTADMLPDGLHPDSEGHRHIFERVKPYILSLLEE